jgi:hypothetical protein
MKSPVCNIFRMVMIAVAVCLLTVDGGAADNRPLSTLEGLVGQWVDLRGQMAQEQRDWELQSARWKQESDLLQQEDEALDSALSRLTDVGESGQARRADLMARRDRLQREREGVETVLTHFEPQLSGLRMLVPDSLMRADLEEAWRPLPEAGDKPAGVTARLQRVLSVLSAIESLQSKTHVTRAMIALPGQPRRQMDVLFLGLACGYAVSADDTLAAVGCPTPEGWVWRSLSVDAAAVRRLIEIANKSIAPELVSFPIGSAGGQSTGGNP